MGKKTYAGIPATGNQPANTGNQYANADRQAMHSITFVHTPTTCKECGHYDAKAKKCKLKVCRYPARR